MAGNLILRASQASAVTDAASDWQSRITGSGVVWYHGFDSVNEVNAFRWASTFDFHFQGNSNGSGTGEGNDPLGNAVSDANGINYAQYVRRITTDGSDKGNGPSCLEIFRPTGSIDSPSWWRPLAPIQGGTTTGNGRGAGQDDPGANGSISAKSYTATQGGGQIAHWAQGGRYGNATYSSEGNYDGTEYYFQVRVKVDPRRQQGTLNSNEDVGKLFYFTRCDRSATDQEIVVYSGTDAAPPNNYFRMYRSVGPALATDSPGIAVHGDQPGTQFGTVGDGVCRLDNNGGRRANCWFWPTDGSWTTILFHVRPGTSTGALGSTSGNNDTLVEVWVAPAGVTSYIKIWDQPTVDLVFDSFHGHNAIIASIYHNGDSMTDFWHRYDQMIFSKSFIPCPQA